MIDTIHDAMQDEITFLRELAAVDEKEGRILAANVARNLASSYQRILNRVKSGTDYSIGIVNGKDDVIRTKSNRKTLEEEYPALKKAAEQYNLMQTLIDCSPEDEEKG